MVLNIGIFPFWGNVSIYDTETETINKFDIAPGLFTLTFENYPSSGLFSVKEDDSNMVDSMFGEIVSKTEKKEIGSVCIALGYSYLNEIRKKFIETAKQNGISKIKIISGKQARFIGMLSRFGIQPRSGDVVWILAVWENNVICDVWQRNGSKFAYKFNGGQSKTKEGKSVSPTSEDFLQLYQKIGLTDKPGMIFAEGFVDETDIKEVFPDCVVSFWKEDKHEWTEYALIMARILGEDNRVMEYDTEGALQRSIELEIGDESLIKVEEFEPLPYHEKVSIETRVDTETELEVIFL